MPSSGSGTGDELPDLHVWYTSNGASEVYQYAAEVKAGDGRVSFDAAKVAGLRSYADKTGALPIAIVHLDYEGDFVFRIDDLHKTPDGNYTVTETRDAPGADTFDDFVQAPYST
jgi:Holliday junction resolvase